MLERSAPSCRIQFYHPNPKTGKENNFYTILVDASVAGIRTEQLDNKYPDNMRHELRERIAFTYKTITWTNNEGNTTASDEWIADSTE